jgi:protocatechuate 3,4-dioxygenase beta subunit
VRTSILLTLIPCLVLAQGPQRRMPPGGENRQQARQGGGVQQEAPEVKPEDMGSVSGTIISALTGEPLRKASVSLTTRGRGGRPLVASTDASGKFTLTNVAPGEYRLVGSRNGFVRQEYGARQPGRSGAALTVNKAQNVTQANIALTPHGVITGRIVDEENEPVQGVQVQAMRTGYAQGRKQLISNGGASTDDRGIYRIYSLAPGKYFISATARGGRMGMVQERQGTTEAYASTYYPGTSDPATAAPIDVGPGAEVPGVDIRLMKTATVTVKGKISGLAAAGDRARAMAVLVPRDGSSFNMFDRRPGTVDRQGGFEIRSVPPGSYTLLAMQFGQTTRASAQMPLQVGNSDVDGVSLTLVPAATLAGAVRTETAGVDLSAVRVTLRPVENSFGGPGPGGPNDPSEHGKDGTFALKNVTTGVYTVNVSGLPAGHYVRSIRYGQEDALARLDLTQGIAGSLDIRLSPEAAALSGSVINDKQQPAAQVSVVIAPDASRKQFPHLYRLTTTDDTGAFSVTGLAPGDYLVYAFETIETGAHQDP